MIVLIGASSGIGKELYDILSKKHNVIGTYNSNPDDKLVKIDLSSDISKFCDSINQIPNPLTLINLSTLSLDNLLINTDLDSWNRSFEINTTSNFLLAKAFLPKMIKDGFGRFIFVSSVVSETSPNGTGAYSSSKSALNGLSRTIAHEYGRFGITSNILSLGYFDKGLINTLTEEKRSNIISRIPSRSLGKVEDIAHAIDFIIETGYLNGSVIRLDGGIE